MARKAANLPDWIFSAPNKRRVIAYVLAPRNSGKVIGERELARALGVDPRGSVDEHLFALAQLGLLQRRERPRRFQILKPSQMTPIARDLSNALNALLAALDEVAEVPLERP